jgi:hypothetical protein
MLNLKEKRGREGKRSTKAKPPWTVNIYLKKKKGQEGKISLLQGWVLVEGG